MVRRDNSAAGTPAKVKFMNNTISARLKESYLLLNDDVRVILKGKVLSSCASPFVSVTTSISKFEYENS